MLLGCVDQYSNRLLGYGTGNESAVGVRRRLVQETRRETDISERETERYRDRHLQSERDIKEDREKQRQTFTERDRQRQKQRVDCLRNSRIT